MKIALAGNPNSGKTSLFNELTGSRQHVGNWPGVTVEKKEGILLIKGKQHTLIDLPGIYTLDPETIEQRLTRDFLFKEKPDLIINILDATNLERNLYFTLQLRETGIPMIIALNMMDEVEKSGTVLHMDYLEKILGVPVAGISAAKGQGVKELLEVIRNYETGQIHIAPFCLGCSDCSRCRMGENRYAFIDSIINRCVEPKEEKGAANGLTEKIDKILLNKYLAFPIFLIIMLLVFSLTFSGLVSLLSDGINLLITQISNALSSALGSCGSPEWVVSLICNGAFPGIGTILTFLPQIAMLFILMSLLEDSGYMARAAILLDRVFAFFGLSGSSFIPMIVGFGCSVPAVMSCRILPTEKDRKLTILLTTFMSCSARLPVYALMTMVFFQSLRAPVIFSLYLLGVVIAVIVAAVLGRSALKGSSTSFVMEVPPYRLPSAKNVLLHTWERVKAFLVRAGTIIFAASVVIWFLQSFTTGMAYTTQAEESLLAAIGQLISPLFAPLGFGNWIASTALLTGVAGKELIVSTFSVLTATGGNTAALGGAVAGMFTPVSAYAFMAFTLLYLPCISTIAAMKREYNSWKWTIGTLALNFSSAWLISFIIFQVGRLIGL